LLRELSLLKKYLMNTIQLVLAKEIISGRKADIVVLDELILRGRGAPEEIIEAADLVTEMREIRHYYAKCVDARVGVER
jgi:cob(I)alamin adenosyltransferase